MSFGNYLMIRNKGLAPIEGLTIIGVSTSRGDSDMIGEFGSGSKYAVAKLLRDGVKPTLYVGSLRCDVDAIDLKVDDGIGISSYKRVVVKYSGSQDGRSRSGTEKLGFATDAGVNDWPDLAMALRELMSNALDRQKREKQPLPEVALVDEPHAKRGYTAWFIPVTEEVLRFYREIPSRFLHFSKGGEPVSKILPKSDRNPSGGRGAVIYKKGVFVREWDEDTLPALFDYNLGEELSLDESRKVDNWAIRAAVSECLANAPADILAVILQSMIDGKKYWEHTLDSYKLSGEYTPHSVVLDRREVWTAAWSQVAGDKAVVVGPSRHLAQMVAGKGLKPVKVESVSWRSALKRYGVATDEDVLSKGEHEGKREIEAHPDHVLAVDRVWSLLEKHKLTLGRPRPAVKGFVACMDGESTTHGYWRDGTVFLDNALVPGQSVNLLKVSLEEVAHHVTQAEDNSRDFQDFAFRLLALEAFGAG